jgi:membrane-bound lytic murein transglycosylase MltF
MVKCRSAQGRERFENICYTVYMAAGYSSGPIKDSGFMRLFFGIIFAFLFVSCSEASKISKIEETQTEPLDGSQFSSSELARIAELRANGGLRALTSVKAGIYLEENDGSISGFHYGLLESFSRWMEVDLIVDINPRFSAYFERDGILPPEVLDGSVEAYVPDAIEDYDVLAANFTILPWRENILRMVPLYPARVMLMIRSDSGISEPADLAGKRVVTRQSTSYERILLELREQQGIDFEIKYSEQDFPDVLLANEADAAAVDSEVAILNIRDRRDLSISVELSEAQLIGWAFNPEDPILAGLFQRFISQSYREGLGDQLWYREYRISLSDYAELIGYELRNLY